MTMTAFSTITEAPGVGASAEQLSMLSTRYDLAARYAQGKSVLEVACGTGIGLGFLSRTAARVVGGDIDPNNLIQAQAHYRGRQRVEVRHLDALQLPFDAGSFDTVLLYEALYYLSSFPQFLAEARQVLHPTGTLIICSVNCRWHGFNRSPFSTRYYGCDELRDELRAAGYTVDMFGGFPDTALTTGRKFKGLVRRAAARSGLIPRTMKGKEFLKRVFYGKLTKLPSEMNEDLAPIAPLAPLAEGTDADLFKVLYAVATPAAQTARRAA